MHFLDLEIFSALAFFLIIALLLIKDRKNLEFHYGIILKRWNKGIEKIDEFVEKNKKLLEKFGNLGIYVSILIGIIGFIILIYFTFFRLEQVFRIVLPTVGGYEIPGPVFSVPFWFWLLAIFIIIASHETMHAVFARMEKVKVKNYGIILLLVLPIGAFVDPEMKQIKRLKLKEKLRIFTSGAFINLVLSFLILLLFFASSFIVNSVTEEYGVAYESLTENSPAYLTNLKGIITKIENYEIRSVIDLINALENLKPGEEVRILTTEGEFKLKLAENPEIKGKAFIGIEGVSTALKLRFFDTDITFLNIFLFNYYQFLFWLILLNLGVAIANLLPWKPFDGGLIFEEIFKKYFGKRRGEKLIKITTLLTFSILLFNLFGIEIIKQIIP